MTWTGSRQGLVGRPRKKDHFFNFMGEGLWFLYRLWKPRSSNNCMYSPHSAAVASISLIPTLGRLSLRPVKNRGNYLSVRVGLLSLLYWFRILCSNVSFTSLFPLYPVQYKFITNCSGGSNILIVHFDVALYFWWQLGEVRGRGSFRKRDEPDFDLDRSHRSSKTAEQKIPNNVL